MEHPNLIAVLYPHQSSPGAIAAIAAPENASLHIPFHKEPASSLWSEEPTWDPEESNKPSLSQIDREVLQLTFNHRPKGNEGFCLGRDKSKCDIFLPTLQYSYPISARHCYLTFDNQNRLILRDQSSHGTTVLYDGKGGEKRRNFTWILGGHSVPDEIEQIVIRFHSLLQFQIIVFKARADPAQYISKIEKFRMETTASPEPYIGGLGLQSQTITAPISGAQSPPQNPIFLKREKLGSGGFGVVTRRWDVSTGVEYACKKPHGILSEEEQLAWGKEIHIMSLVKHKNIVKFYPEIGGHEPCLYLDYLPCGNLKMQHRSNPFSYKETLVILHQCLSALKYLHEKNPPIAHRDLKPENILVRERNPLHIQLADFGLAKEGTSLRSRVGTECYVPPEYFMAAELGEKYSVKIDIWSLGVVALDLTHSLPTDELSGISWCDKIIDRVDQYKSEGPMQFLKTHMLVLKPED
ncbi:conserved hypothetical protein [Histoplasma capsulatum H143]|uniref:non-specific serine/threonine protein kinase n=1 Tax=Ajellomyces capsulatus (strain H143) TaxID=544712 RepID=C6HBP2_AJECH|nr:conserved hypothetical protein [Histoplasma capsulatum H143]EER41983.1 conserved hypothetical protein [Histoplasma capsulatum H143]